MGKRTAKPTEIPEGDPVIDPPPDGFDDDESEKAFSQLRYFFWTYLHWEVRNHLIAAIKLAPDAGRMIPQTIEMTMLQTAQSMGSLSTLWDLMMPFLPPARRAENPFPTPVPSIDYATIKGVAVSKEPDGAFKVVIDAADKKYTVIGKHTQKVLKLLREHGWPVTL